MKKEMAEYLNTTRQLETIVYDEGNRFMYDLSNLPGVLRRWAEYKEIKTESAQKLTDIKNILKAEEGGKTTIKEIEEEKDWRNKEATSEEILNVGSKTKVLLQIIDQPATYVKELGEELSGLKKTVLTAIAAKLFNILFLN